MKNHVGIPGCFIAGRDSFLFLKKLFSHFQCWGSNPEIHTGWENTQVVNILGFKGHTFFLATTQLTL